MKEIIFQWLKDWLCSMIRKCLPVIVISTLTVTTAYGQGIGGGASNRQPVRPASMNSSKAEQTFIDEDWTECEVQSIRFRLPDHWHLLPAEEIDLASSFKEIAKVNPHLQRIDVDKVRELDAYAVNTRDSGESFMETMSIKIIDKPMFDRTTARQFAPVIAEQLKSQRVAEESQCDFIKLNGVEVGRIRFVSHLQNPNGQVVEIEGMQFVFVSPRTVTFVSFGHPLKGADKKHPELEAIAKTFQF